MPGCFEGTVGTDRGYTTRGTPAGTATTPCDARSNRHATDGPSCCGARRIRIVSDLQRFVEAQAGVYDGVIEELRRGRKSGHWIWFVFPQMAGLGRSWMSQQYAIGSIAEARAYLAHPVLGPRLRECATLILSAPSGRTAPDILGELDAMKVRSSMTLFGRAAPDEPVFGDVLRRFFGGTGDPATDALLAIDDA